MDVEQSASWVQRRRSALLVSSPTGLELEEVHDGGEVAEVATECEGETQVARSVEAVRQRLASRQGQAKVAGAAAWPWVLRRSKCLPEEEDRVATVEEVGVFERKEREDGRRREKP